MSKINVAIVGVGNCCSSLVQGLEYYKDIKDNEKFIPGLVNPVLGGYKISDINVVVAFDVDKRKVGKDLSEAIFSEPNCTKRFADVPYQNVIVMKCPVLDGIADHMHDFFQVDKNQKELSKDKIIDILKESKCQILLNYCPVGSIQTTEFYAKCCLEAGVSLINNIPVFIASNKIWAQKFEDAGIPIIGDDIKSELGATILHRSLANLFVQRGVTLDRTYQLNVAGNADFLNMLDRTRLKSKKISKTEAVQSILSQPLNEGNIHIGPSDYIPFQKDEKICYLRMEGRIFGNIQMNLELRLSVEDSPNSSGCVVDCIRLAKIALNRKIGGPLIGPSAFYMKHPPEQYDDNTARQMVENFINNKG